MQDDEALKNIPQHKGWWKTNYKSMNLKQIEDEIYNLSVNPNSIIYEEKETRLAYLAVELNLKKSRPG